MSTQTDGIIVDIATDQFHINKKKIRALAAKICSYLGLSPCELSLQFIDTQAMHALNLEYRQKDSSTDVLSFPQMEWKHALCVHEGQKSVRRIRDALEDGHMLVDDCLVLGDIVVSLEDALNNAQQIGQGLDRETCFLLIHGILHLCGHDHLDPDEEELMLGQQNAILAKLEHETSPPLWAQCVELYERKS